LSPSSLLFVLLAVASGASLVVQQALNANLRTALNSAALSGFVSYFVGTLCMVLLALAIRDPLPTAAAAARVPWWSWSGGLFGAIYIGLSILLLPKLGATAFVGLLIAGQMITSLVFDNYGLLGLAQRSIDAPRLIGVALLIAGWC
jgi:Uncharacterized protein conserved in bacteria